MRYYKNRRSITIQEYDSMQKAISELKEQCKNLADNCIKHGEYIFKLEQENKRLKEENRIFRIQIEAALRAQSLGLCKNAIKSAFDHIKALEQK